MSLIVWSKQLQTGHTRIDAEHQQLVRMLNDLHAAMGDGRGNEVLGKLLAELVSYTVSHFNAEERLMVQSAYPDAAKHKREHEDLKTKVLQLQRDLGSGRGMLTLEALRFLKTWLSNHILGSDMALGKHLAAKAVTA